MISSAYRDAAVICVAALAMLGTLPGRTQGLGLVTKPLLDNLHLDSGLFATINLWATLIGAACCVPIGRLFDWLGSRVVLVGVAIALGCAVLWMSRVTAAVPLFVTVTLTRGLGQSALSVVSLAIVGKWYVQRVGMAMGVYSFLVGIGFIASFVALREILPRTDWRSVWAGLGWLLILGLAPAAWLLPRKKTAPTKDHARLECGGDESDGFSLWNALQTPAFWLFATASSTYLLAASGVSLFNELILNDLGFEARTYHTGLIYGTATGLLSNFLGGWMAIRWSMGRVMAVGMALLAGSLVTFPHLKTEAQVYIQASAMGLAGGIVTVVFFAIWSKAYGRPHLGKIQGAAQMMTVVASAVGPLIFDAAKQRTGSYALIFYTLSSIVALLGIGTWFVRLPRPEEGAPPTLRHVGESIP